MGTCRMRFLILCMVGTVSFSSTVYGQGTPAPPDWQDSRGTSVYMPATAVVPTAVVEIAPPVAATPAPSAPPVAEPALVDSRTPVASHVSAGKPDGGRRLAPPNPSKRTATATAGNRPAQGVRQMLEFGIPSQTLITMGSALAIVIGAFLVFAWTFRKGSSKFSRGKTVVPAEAVCALGRVALAGRHHADLLRVGNKLVLVATTPSGPVTLTEVTDPVEVDRIVGLCQQFGAHSSTKAFEEVFQQFTSEPVTGGFLGGGSMPMSLTSAAAAYRNQREVGRA